MTRDWDAEGYERNSAPIAAMGTDVVARLELRGDETVLDAGSGTGRVTAQLAERLPRGHVIAVDGSPSMVEQARRRLPGATLICADLLDLELPEPVDVVFSTATFHWVHDHERLFARLRAALKPGGRLVAQCGGAGNIADLRAAIERVRPGLPDPWNFATPEETERRLRAAGFASARCWLHRIPVRPEDPREYFRVLVLGSHLEHLPPAEHDAFVDAVLAEVGEPVVDYVRLEVDAVTNSR